MNDGYIVVDTSNSIADINKAALELAGKARKEVIGKDLGCLFGEEVDILGRTPEGNFGREISLQIGSETRFFTVSISPLMTRDDAEGKLVMIHDITEIYRYQDALKQANKKINLMSNITRHDILNQVNVLSGYTELISEMLPPNVREIPGSRSTCEILTKELKQSIARLFSPKTIRSSESFLLHGSP
jgi:PAS domain S-box-containing protein